MTEIEQRILSALLDMEQALANIQTAKPKPNLLEHFEKIEYLTGELPRGTDRDLLHYLHKKSYEKARLHLQGRAAENAEGTCR
ncbi:MAG: hypothetical protein CMO80_15080 [Verrucomicrobiales bacterium]|nr:hypothetical protein [Verrucomicrobiales bacterium]|tara:strand:+ start:464 stop:712 length:249 start_codon:yes stop_codon:yes gene_type:complete